MINILKVNSRFFGKTQIQFKNNIAYLFGRNNSKKTILLNEIYNGIMGRKINDIEFDDSFSNIGNYQTIF